MDNNHILIGLVILTISCIYLFYLNYTKHNDFEKLSREVNTLKKINKVNSEKLLLLNSNLEKAPKSELTNTNLVEHNNNNKCNEIRCDETICETQCTLNCKPENLENDVVNDSLGLTSNEIDEIENLDNAANNDDNLHIDTDNTDNFNLENNNIVELNENFNDNIPTEDVELDLDIEVEETNINETSDLEVEEQSNEMLLNEEVKITEQNIIVESVDENEMNLDLNLEVNSLDNEVDSELNNLIDQDNLTENNIDNSQIINNLDSMTLKELRVAAKNIGLKTKGNKDDIISRIKEKLTK